MSKRRIGLIFIAGLGVVAGCGEQSVEDKWKENRVEKELRARGYKFV